MTGTVNEFARRRRRVLRFLAARGGATTDEVVADLGLERVRVFSTLTALERYRYIQFNPTTNTFHLTETGMRRMKKSKSSPTAGELVPASGGGPNVVNLRAEADRLALEIHGPARFALDAVQDEPDLWESLSAALANGMTPPVLIDLPRRKRVQHVEETLATWATKTKNGPCDACGTRAAIPGYAAVSYADPVVEPAFQTREITGRSYTMCDWCSGFLTANDGSLPLLRERVGMALVGAVGVAAGGAGVLKFASPKIVPLAVEVGVYSATPWGHLTGSPEYLRAIHLISDQRVHPSRLVRTVAQRDNVAVPGIATPIHDAPERPAYVAPTVALSDGSSYDEQISAAKQRHYDEQVRFKVDNPPAYVPGGAPWTDDVSRKWYAMLMHQRNELAALDKKFPRLGDGRPRAQRGYVNPLAAAR